MTSYTLQDTIDETLSRQGCGDNLVIARKDSGVMNTVCTGFSFPPRGDFQPLFPNIQFRWTEKYKTTLLHFLSTANSYVPFQVWLRRSSTNKLIYIERATEDVHIDVGEVTIFDEYNLTAPAEKHPAGFFPKAGSFGVKGVPNSLNVSVLMHAGDWWSAIYVD